MISISGLKSLFFDNTNARQTIFKNISWLAVTEGISKLLKLVLLIYVARILGATEYGKFSFAFAFIGLFTVFFSLGLPRIIVRELSRDREKEKDFSSLLSLRILLSFGTLILIFIGSFFITPNPLIRTIIWILAAYTLLDSFAAFLNFFFQARQRMEYESWTRILRAVLLVGFGLFVIFNFPSVKNLSYGYLLASLISFIFILLFFHLKIYSLRLHFDTSIWRRYLSMSWPLAFSGIFIALYGQIDSVMMGYLNQITETGWYNAAYRIAGVAFIPIGLMATSFYPALSKTFKESKDEFQKDWNNLMGIMIALAIPIVVGGIVLAPKIINFIYDQNYTASILAFQILIIMVGISFLHTPFNQALLISNQQIKFFWISISGLTTNVALNLLLIPRYSLYGAAIATVITAFVVLLVFIGITRRFTSVKILNQEFFWAGILAIFSALIMYFVISYPNIYNLHVSFSIIIGGLTYFTIFFGSKFIIKRIFYGFNG